MDYLFLQAKIDELGRFRIGKKMQEFINFSADQQVEIFISYGKIHLRPFDSRKIKEQKFLGIVRYIDRQYRVSIPAEYMDVLGFQYNSKYDVCVTRKEIIIEER